MNLKKLFVLCFTLLLGVTLLTGCSNGPSQEAKDLYNEQAKILNKKIEYLQTCLKDEKATTRVQFGYPTSFFHLTADEKKVWEDADFGDEKAKQLDAAKEVEKDASALNNAVPQSALNTTQEEIDHLNNVFSGLKEKYKDFDYEKVKVTLYE